ncbi:hypothetical protein SAMN05661080_03774 [Modestobacter sp. DSM 44400]|uniref:hypothetical protein n=1 Tax=Modestobacter sp. DSM 44400 TaxID=1550230 RepID=UPI00089BE20D|nr:hypothetical protein [Modestobacter sp. DSM 44400]SDY53160.1 hypothetical protein SAMN05661080_03774 [Modestobacter sp. DSM 44400]
MVSWRTPNSHLTAGPGGGPPPQVLRDPGHPPGLSILDERSSDYDARLKLLNRILEAAARSTLREEIPALARVLVDGLQVEGDVGEALVLAAALDLLEEPHVVLLKHLRIHAKPPVEQVEVMIYAYLYGWQVEHVERVLPRFAGIADGLVAVLAGQGLLRDAGHINFPGAVGPAAWAITPLGERCLFLLGGGQSDPGTAPAASADEASGA